MKGEGKGRKYPESPLPPFSVVGFLRGQFLPQVTIPGRDNWEQANLGKAKFGTIKMCSVVPWYLKVGSHFSRCHFFALSACAFLGVPNNKHPEASRKQEQPSKQPSRSLQETPNSYGPYPYCSLDNPAAGKEHMQMGSVALVQAPGHAQGPSNQHLWAPSGEQEPLKRPSARQRDILTSKPLSYVAAAKAVPKLSPKLIRSLRLLWLGQDRSLAIN